MLEYWLTPTALSNSTNQNTKGWSLKNNISKKIVQKKNSKPQIALIGLNPELADGIRSHLFKFSWAFDQFDLVDLGNFKKEDTNFSLPLIQDLIQGGVFPILLGSQNNLLNISFSALKTTFSIVNIAIIDEKIKLGNGVSEQSQTLDDIIRSKRPQLNDLSILGFQTPFSPKVAIEFLNKFKHNLTRLGEMRTNPSILEPILRRTDSIFVNTDVLDSVCNPLKSNHNPSGLNIEEFCQMAYFAGLNENLKVAAIQVPSESNSDFVFSSTSQFIWYLLDGMNERLTSLKGKPDRKIYHVKNNKSTEGYQFIHCNKTDRWWFEIPTNQKKYKRIQLFPCTYEEYLASFVELPARLYLTLLKFN
jgi:formiminoglutamase